MAVAMPSNGLAANLVNKIKENQVADLQVVQIFVAHFRVFLSMQSKTSVTDGVLHFLIK